MNGIIHPCSHPEDKPPPESEAEMYKNIMDYVDRYNMSCQCIRIYPAIMSYHFKILTHIDMVILLFFVLFYNTVTVRVHNFVSPLRSISAHPRTGLLPLIYLVEKGRDPCAGGGGGGTQKENFLCGARLLFRCRYKSFRGNSSTTSSRGKSACHGLHSYIVCLLFSFLLPYQNRIPRT